MKNFVIILVFGLILISCAKTTKGEWMVYEEEVCLPFWTDEDSHNKSRNNLATFLKAEGIIPLKIKIEGERIPECEDCYCKTGISYEVQVDRSQAGLMLYYGFKTK